MRERVQGAIALLTPVRPPASHQFKGRPGRRVRVGAHRINYTIADDVLPIVLITAGHRREVYDR